MPKTGLHVTLCGSAFVLMIGVGMIVALLPQRMFSISGSLESVGMIASVFAISYLAIQFPAGLLADRVGPRPVLFCGYLCCGIAGLVFYFGNSLEALVFGRFIQGIGEAPIWALGPAVLSSAYPSEKGRVIGMYNAAIHGGLTIGPLLGLLLIPTAPYDAAFLLFAGCGFAGGLVVLLFLPRNAQPISTTDAERATPGRLLAVLATHSSRRTLTGVLLYGGCYGVFVTILPVTLSLRKAFDADAVNVFFALFYAAVGISQLIAGPLSDRFGRYNFMAAGMLMAAFGVGGFEWLSNLGIDAALVVASLGLGLFCVASLANLNDGAPAGLKGAISGSYYLAWSLGYFLMPLVIGRLEATAPGVGYSVLSVLLATQACGYWRRRRLAVRRGG